MHKLLLLISLICLSAKNYAQIKRVDNQVKIDSSELLKDFMELMKVESPKPASYFIVGVGISNSLLSGHNKAISSKQSSAQTIVYSPAISYYNKSGLNITAGANYLQDSVSGFGVNQYSIAPGYQLQNNENVDFSVIYTHYFVMNEFSDYASPIQNDLYSTFTYKKTWLEPGVAVDFASGQYKSNTRKKLLYDSMTNKLNSFTFIASIAHESNWESVFTKDDNLLFTSSLSLNSGNSNLAVYHNTNTINRLELEGLVGKARKAKLPKFQNTNFEAQSFGFDLNLNYAIEKFTIEPDYI